MSLIEEAIGQIEEWKGKAISIQPLSGGLTNVNYRVDVDGTPVSFLRSVR